MAMDLKEIESFIKEAMPDAIVEILNNNSVHHEKLGVIIDKDMIIDQKTKLTIDELKSYNTNWLKSFMV